MGTVGRAFLPATASGGQECPPHCSRVYPRLSRSIARAATASALLAATLVIAGCAEHAVRPPEPRAPKARVAVLSIYSVPEMNRRYLPLIRRLGEKSGLDLEYVSTLDYETYASTTASGVEFGLQNALAYIQLHKTRNARPLARAITRDAKDAERGVIVAHPAAHIRAIDDLRGKRVLLASRRAVAGYMAQAEQCLDAGLDPERDLVLVAGLPQDDVLPRLATGAAHAAFVRESVWKSALSAGRTSGLQLVAETKAYPTWCFAALGDVPPIVESSLQEALLTLDRDTPDDWECLEQAGVAGFAPATDADYDPVRRLAEKLRIPL